MIVIFNAALSANRSDAAQIAASFWKHNDPRPSFVCSDGGCGEFLVDVAGDCDKGGFASLKNFCSGRDRNAGLEMNRF